MYKCFRSLHTKVYLIAHVQKQSKKNMHSLGQNQIFVSSVCSELLTFLGARHLAIDFTAL